MDALEFTARHGQVARLLGTAGQQHGVELGHELLGADGFLGPVGDLGVFAQAVLARHQHAGTDLDAFGHELLDAAVDVRLLQDRKSTRLNSSHLVISYAVFCLKKKKKTISGHLFRRILRELTSVTARVFALRFYVVFAAKTGATHVFDSVFEILWPGASHTTLS